MTYLGRLGQAGTSSGVTSIADKVTDLTDSLVEAIEAVEHAQHHAHEAANVQDEAKVFATQVIPAQDALREVADELELYVADDLWPLPKYRELLFQY